MHRNWNCLLWQFPLSIFCFAFKEIQFWMKIKNASLASFTVWFPLFLHCSILFVDFKCVRLIFVPYWSPFFAFISSDSSKTCNHMWWHFRTHLCLKAISITDKTATHYQTSRIWKKIYISSSGGNSLPYGSISQHEFSALLIYLFPIVHDSRLHSYKFPFSFIHIFTVRTITHKTFRWNGNTQPRAMASNRNRNENKNKKYKLKVSVCHMTSHYVR